MAPEVEALSLPLVGNHPKNKKYDIFERQTYFDFATKAHKNNPDFEFSKETMDQAFELVSSRFRRNFGAVKAKPADFDRMMARVSLEAPA